jgi:hypothetical protein
MAWRITTSRPKQSENDGEHPMSASSEIAAKWHAMKTAGLDLGPPAAAEADAGYGGRVQRYASGNIYWHPNTGAHEVHGGILARYLALGGPGVDRRSGRRLLGFPTTDETRTVDGLHPMSRFEWGTIFWAWEGCFLSGELDEAWRRVPPPFTAGLTCGYPLQDQMGAAGGEVTYLEHGCWWVGDASQDRIVAFELSLPRLGRPALWDPGAPASTPLPIAIECTTSADVLEHLRQAGRSSLFTELWQGRLVLKRVVAPGAPEEEIPIECRLGLLPNEEYFKPIGPLHCFLPQGASLAERALYDVWFRRSDGRKDVRIAPHAIYSKSSWEDFGFAHATDIHVSRRLEKVRQRLTELNQTEGSKEFHNYNDAFRDFIRYANHLHDLNLIDLIIATGDLVDYEFEQGENLNGGGNFAFFKSLILGKAPYPDPSTAKGKAQELRVPIFTVPGNHDYRRAPYPFIVSVDVIASDKEIGSYAPHNLTRQEAICLSPGQERPTYSTWEARKFVEPDEAILAYHRELNDKGSYTVRLGRHRLVMLNSRWDAGVIGASWSDQLDFYLFGSENQRNFAAANPDQRGFTDQDRALLEEAVRGAGADGLVIVGVHAPLLNPKGNERAFYFRETVHAAADQRQITGYLLRQSPASFYLDQYGTFAVDIGREQLEGWTQQRLPAVGSFFAYGDGDQLLDYGTAEDRNEDMLRRCAGQGMSRPVDLVLFGHGHYNVEFRLRRRDWDELEFYSDFYTENPSFYYQSSLIKDPEAVFREGRVAAREVQAATIKVAVNVEPGAGPRPEPRLVRQAGYQDYYLVGVPPYRTPLNQASDPVAWWKEHRPLLLQTPGLGPLENSQREEQDEERRLISPNVSFNGFRVGRVREGTIHSIRLVRLADLRAHNFVMPWEPRSTLDPLHPPRRPPVSTGRGVPR